MEATLTHRLPLQCLFPNNFSTDHPKPRLNCSFFRSKVSSSKCPCTQNDNNPQPQEGFSVLKPDIKGDTGSIWSSMGFYVFSIHVPLSYGGLSTAAKILNQTVLDPQTEAFLLLGIQALELSVILLLLRCPGKPQYDLSDFFNANKSSKQRSCLLASLLGFGFLFSLVFVTSYVANWLIGPKDVNDPFLKDILSSGSSSIAACVLTYCIVTPLLEEIVYRGFLVTSLASKMNWLQAVAISSIAFSASHFSGILNFKNTPEGWRKGVHAFIHSFS